MCMSLLRNWSGQLVSWKVGKLESWKGFVKKSQILLPRNIQKNSKLKTEIKEVQKHGL